MRQSLLLLLVAVTLLLLLLRIAVVQIVVPIELRPDAIPNAQISQMSISHFKVCIFGF